MILLDTNLLARVTDKAHPHCTIARVAIHTLLSRRERLVIVPQNMYEFWAVATRMRGRKPVGQNGLGMTPAQSSQWLAYFLRRFSLLIDQDDLSSRWHDMVKAHRISGVASHDARLVAAMHCHGMTRLLTFNAKDFKGLGVTIIDPSSV